MHNLLSNSSFSTKRPINESSRRVVLWSRSLGYDMTVLYGICKDIFPIIILSLGHSFMNVQWNFPEKISTKDFYLGLPPGHLVKFC